MRRSPSWFAAAIVLFLVQVIPAEAGYTPCCWCLNCQAEDSAHPASPEDEPQLAAFAFLGTPKTKWEPGPNTASTHTFSPPNGPRTPGGATFSIMGAGIGFHASASDPEHGANLTSAITALNVPGFTTVDHYAQVVHWALDQWASVSGFRNLGRVADSGAPAGAPNSLGGHLGDIRVAAWELTSIPLIAHAFQPGTEALLGAGWTLGGDIHLDVGRAWVNDPNDVPNNGRYDIYTLVLHEVGHALGLGHSTVPGAVMQSSYPGSRRQLHADDIAAIQALYGVPEPHAGVLAAAGLLFGLAARRCSRRFSR
jgi:hypothetical protein